MVEGVEQWLLTGQGILPIAATHPSSKDDIVVQLGYRSQVTRLGAFVEDGQTPSNLDYEMDAIMPTRNQRPKGLFYKGD
jgi:hypothetical protein